MLSTQFLEILNFCKENNVGISYSQIAALCNKESAEIKRIIELFKECEVENRSAFLEIMLDIEYMEYHKYEGILDIVSNIDVLYLDTLMKQLRKPFITKLPKLFDYVNILYLIANTPAKIYSREVKASIIEVIPDIEFEDDITTVESFLLATMDADYENQIKYGDIICFEDMATSFTSDLEKYFAFHRKNKEIKAMRLIRAINPENMPKNPQKKDNIIRINFKGE
ncbi:MAG: hypothetical protein IJN03_01270 [Bacilli bacterium]|nr:hypothetical protein [Bacilli bacterium]